MKRTPRTRSGSLAELVAGGSFVVMALMVARLAATRWTRSHPARDAYPPPLGARPGDGPRLQFELSSRLMSDDDGNLL